MLVKTLKVEDSHDRKKLCEGRSFGLGFSLAKKKAVNKYIAAHATSPCKDYLNDVVWSEATGREGSACGLTYAKSNILEGNRAYLLAKILNCSRSNPFYNDSILKLDTKSFAKQDLNIKNAMNWFEKKLGLKTLTSVKSNSSGWKVITMDTWWTKYPYLISLYTLLIRNLRYYDGSVDPLEFIEKLNDPKFVPEGVDKDEEALFRLLVDADKNLLNKKTIGKIHKLIQKGAVDDGTGKNSTPPHGKGIINFDF